jgi:lipopolysaccharide export system protein LptC
MAVAETGGQDRARVFAVLKRRNRIVAGLRIAVPAVGVVAMLAVGAGIVLDGLLNQFGIARIHIDRNNLVVDTPELSSTLADGTVISLAASSAKLVPNDSDRVGLTDARFEATLSGGLGFTAIAAAANLTLSTQTIRVPGRTDVTTSDGAAGHAEKLTVDALGFAARSEGPVTLTFQSGNRLEAADMIYDHQSRLITFHKVKLWLVSTPGAAQ